MVQGFDFTGTDTAGASCEISLNSGNTFAVANKWLTNHGQDVVFEDCETLTFVREVFTREQVFAPAAPFAVGFLVSELDGNN